MVRGFQCSGKGNGEMDGPMGHWIYGKSLTPVSTASYHSSARLFMFKIRNIFCLHASRLSSPSPS